MPWIQVKYGIAVLYAGILTLGLDSGHAVRYVTPLCVGALIVMMGSLAHVLRNAGGKKRIWHFMALHWNTLSFVFLAFWAGICSRYALDTGPFYCAITIACLSSLVLFLSSDPFQEEHEYLEGIR